MSLNSIDQINIFLSEKNSKNITIIQGLNPNRDFKQIVKRLKSKLNCNGCVVDDQQWGRIIQISGDKIAFITSDDLNC